MMAGEYAVLEPGRPVIAVAVDRYVSVTVSATASGEPDVVIASDLLPHEVALRRTPQGPQSTQGRRPKSCARCAIPCGVGRRDD